MLTIPKSRSDETALTVPKAKFEIFYLQGPEGPVTTLRKLRRSGRKGTKNRRIIKIVTEGGYEWSYHATRGWRKNKA